MQVIFYHNKSDNNVVSKDISEVTKVLNINVLGECSLLNPSMVLEKDMNIYTSNYCYIADFNRYYFIKNITFLNGGLMKVELEIDVLMSYKNDIYNSTAFIERSEKNGNVYLNDSFLPILTERDIKLSNAFGGFSQTLYNYITVISG